MILFLVGYMGCGKSTIGRTVAKRLGVEFVDMDRRIEERAAMSVAEVFASRGEAAFRQMERAMLEELTGGEGDRIVATGGGVPVHGDNMEVMNRAGLTVYFKMAPRGLVQRLKPGQERRPLLRGMDERELLRFVEHNLAQRAPFYERARMTIDCNGVSDEYIARHIEELIRHNR